MKRKSERHALPGDVWHHADAYTTWIIVGRGVGYRFEKVWAAFDVDRRELIQRATHIDRGFSKQWERIAP